MRIHKLNKSGVLKRYMQIDPETDVGKYTMAKDSSYMLVKAAEVVKTDDGAEIKLMVIPAPRAGRGILVELSPSLAKLGRVTAPLLVREGEKLEVHIASKAKDLESAVLDLEYAVRLTLIYPELI